MVFCSHVLEFGKGGSFGFVKSEVQVYFLFLVLLDHIIEVRQLVVQLGRSLILLREDHQHDLADLDMVVLTLVDWLQLLESFGSFVLVAVEDHVVDIVDVVRGVGSEEVAVQEREP